MACGNLGPGFPGRSDTLSLDPPMRFGCAVRLNSRSWAFFGARKSFTVVDAFGDPASRMADARAFNCLVWTVRWVG